MEELVKECSKVTIEYEMKVMPADGTGPVTGSKTCSFVMGVDLQYPSVETALMNKKAGDRVMVYIPPEEIFGVIDPGLVRELPRADYKQERLKAGRMYREMKRGCLVQFMVKELRDETIVADFNDQRAGTWAEFDIVIKEVRPAKKEEMQPECAKMPEFLQ
ncbi:MAG: FKBP-type peptidyl-prolyl cis-trans isomerase [Deltaproteobacteria bacterium]|jgi:FKBP-type peptidyl-prolyl cis-trans isomerase SlyD|nr:FKBP-type peptidyl-prolyl cis-trans isomerase [Deltaproteobacteria bacterium]